MNCYDLFVCYDRRGREWETKENNYITQLKRLQDSLRDLIEQQNALHDYAISEKMNWELKEANLNEKIAILQNELHQKEVITEQYKVYEDNYQQERKQIVQLQIELVDCKGKVQNLEKEIFRLNDLILQYQRKIEHFSEENGLNTDVLKENGKNTWILKKPLQNVITSENELIKNKIIVDTVNHM